MKALWSFKMLAPTDSKTQCHMPEDLNLEPSATQLLEHQILLVCMFRPAKFWMSNEMVRCDMLSDKGKGCPITCHASTDRRQRYSSTRTWLRWSVVSAMPQPLYPWKETRHPLHRALGGPWGQSGQICKILPPLAPECRTFQPIANCNTDFAIPASILWDNNSKLA
jgi:hypothetical protein